MIYSGHKIRLYRAILFGLIILLSAPPLSAAELPTVRLWPTAERTRLVIETTLPLEYKVGGLTNPARLVLDVAIAANVGKKLKKTDISVAPYLADFRFARRESGEFRFVFELRDESSHKLTRIKPIAGYGYRLIWDIEPKTRPDPLFDLITQLNKREQASAIGDTTAAKPLNPFLLVIDPGHGGEDPGAISRRKRQEKRIVLTIAKKLRNEINQYPNMKAVLTRSVDKFLKLEKRVQIAQRLNADAFVSIHADSVKSPKPQGSSVFVLSEKGASTPLAKRLAKRENLSDLIGGDAVAADPDTIAVLRQFSVDGKDRASREMAELILANIGKINILHSKKPEAAGFAVLKSSAIPSVLVETAFISNPKDESNLLDENFQNKMAAAIAGALQEYKNRHHLRDE